MQELSSYEEFQSLLKSGEEFIVDFWAEWCKPCKMLEDVLKSVEGELGELKIYRVNTDDELGQQILSEYNIMAIPTLIYFKDGKEVDRLVGTVPKKELLNWIKFLCSGMPVDEKGLIDYLESLERRFESLSKICLAMKKVVQGKSYSEVRALVDVQPAEIKEALIDFLNEMKLK